LLDLLGRRPRWGPYVALAAALILWDLVAPLVTSNPWLALLPNPAVRGGLSIWIGALLLAGSGLPGRKPLGVLLVLSGLHSFDFPWLANSAAGLGFGLGLSQFFNIAISGFLFIVLLDEARRGAQRADAALSKSEEKFAIAFRSSPLPSLITRLDDGLMIDVNDAFCTATGYVREDVIGRSTKDVIWPEPERRATMVAHLRADGRVKNLELKMRTKTGAPLDVLASLEVIELDGVPHTLGAVIDVTQQNLALDALRDSEERFRRLVQDLNVGWRWWTARDACYCAIAPAVTCWASPRPGPVGGVLAARARAPARRRDALRGGRAADSRRGAHRARGTQSGAGLPPLRHRRARVGAVQRRPPAGRRGPGPQRDRHLLRHHRAS